MLKKLKNNQGGFTIIEVMIVLAIAGLILLIVLLAVPALKRNSHNTTAKNDASTVAAGINEAESNSNGTVPTNVTTTVVTDTVNANINLSGSATVAFTAGNGGFTTTLAYPAIQVYTNTNCSGTTATGTVAIVYGLDGQTTGGCQTT
jgi:prepilin-type N-terminal cleavage/methylation domain-containing protein